MVDKIFDYVSAIIGLVLWILVLTSFISLLMIPILIVISLIS